MLQEQNNSTGTGTWALQTESEMQVCGDFLEEYQKKDGRIRVRNLEENRGIAVNTNAALEMASGDFAALLDHDDLLEPDALMNMAALLKKNPDMDAVYTDEDKVNGQGNFFFQPHFKPDFNPDLLRSNNYICHFFAVRTDLARRTRRIPKGV